MKEAEYLDYDRIGSVAYGAAVHYAHREPFYNIPSSRNGRLVLEALTEEDIAKGQLNFFDLLFESVFCPVLSFENHFWDAALYVCQDLHVQRFIGCVAPDTDSISEMETIPGYRLLGQRQLATKDLDLAEMAADIRPVWKVFELMDEHNDGYFPRRISVLLLNVDSTKAFQAAFGGCHGWVPRAFMLPLPAGESECPDYLDKESSFYKTVRETCDCLAGLQTYPVPNSFIYPSLYFSSRAGGLHTKDTVAARFGWPGFHIKRAAFSQASNVFVFTRGKKITPRKMRIYSGKKCLEIYQKAFHNDKDLKEFYIPEDVGAIGWEAFAGCESLDTVTLPDSVETIGKEAFTGCKKLRSVVIPPKVKELKRGVFSHCEGLASVVLPEGLENIRLGCFFKCFALEEVRIPSTVKRIGEDAFGMCQGLRRVEIPSAAIVDPNAFRYANPQCEFVYYDAKDAEPGALS